MGLLESFVKENHYSFEESFDNWEDAVWGAAKPLLADGTLDNCYVEKIIENVHTYGPYFVIAPNVAMPHSTLGGNGVHKTTIGFMKVEKPVVFDPEDRSKDAQLFFTLAAVDNEQHLKNIQMLMELLMTDGLTDDLAKATCKEDLVKLAEKYSM